MQARKWSKRTSKLMLTNLQILQEPLKPHRQPMLSPKMSSNSNCHPGLNLNSDCLKFTTTEFIMHLRLMAVQTRPIWALMNTLFASLSRRLALDPRQKMNSVAFWLHSSTIQKPGKEPKLSQFCTDSWTMTKHWVLCLRMRHKILAWCNSA